MLIIMIAKHQDLCDSTLGGGESPARTQVNCDREPSVPTTVNVMTTVAPESCERVRGTYVT